MRFDRLLATLAFVFLALALLIIALTGPARGYEISIYDAYPVCFWAFLICSIACGISILVRNAFSEKQSQWWVAGLVASTSATAVFLLLPLFRGYEANGFFDPLMQMGLTRDIELTGHFGLAGTAGENLYPASHILAMSIVHATGLSVEQVLEIMPAVRYVFYVGSICLLSQTITQSKGQSLLIVAFAALPLITSSNESMTAFVPRIQTFLLLPFTLYLFNRNRAVAYSMTEYAIPLVTVLLSMPFFHPFDGGVFLMLILVCLGMGPRIVAVLRKTVTGEPDTTIPRNAATGWGMPVMLLLVAWFAWFSGFSMFFHFVGQIRDWVVADVGESESQRYLSFLGSASVPIAAAVSLFVKREGHHLLYFAMSAVLTAILWWRLLVSKRKDELNMIVFSFLFVVWVIFMAMSFVIALELGYMRFVSYAVFFSAVTMGLGVFWLYTRFGHGAMFSAGTVTFVTVCLALGILNCYASPFTASNNQQVTASDMHGLSWFLERRADYVVADQMTFTQYNHAAALRGCLSVPNNIRKAYLVETTIPEHFGFDQHANYGNAVDDDRYFLSHNLDRIFYTERIPEYESAWKWSPEDFERLESDATVDRLYTSGDFEVFYVRAQA